MKIIDAKKICLATLCGALSFPLYATTFHKPIIVNNAYVKEYGRVITGNYTGTLTQPAISITTSTPVLITNSTVQGPGDLIYIAGGSDVTVENTVGIATNPNVANTQKGMFIDANYVQNLQVRGCTIQGVRYGIYVNGYTGDRTLSQRIVIYNNTFTNIDGRLSNGNNGYITSGSYIAHAIQLNQVTQVPNVEIAWNLIQNLPNSSQSNDVISIYDSSGLSTSPILIHDNFLQGAFPAAPGVDTSYFGSGIVLDGNSSGTIATTTAFTSVYHNDVVNMANYGIAIKAGHDNSVYNNRVVSGGRLASNAIYAVLGAAGLSNINFYNQAATVFFNNNMYNNTSGLVTINATGTAIRSDMNLPGQSSTENNVSFSPTDPSRPTLADEAAELSNWKNHFAKNKH